MVKLLGIKMLAWLAISALILRILGVDIFVMLAVLCVAYWLIIVRPEQKHSDATK